MKKGFLSLLVLAIWLSSAAAARADYAVSVGFSSGDYGHRHHSPIPPAHFNHGRYDHGYYWWPEPVVYKETVYIENRSVAANQDTTAVLSREKLGVSDIIVLAKAGVSDDNIVDRIAKTGSVYHLTAEEITLLNKEGVSNRVINFMLLTAK